MSARAGMYDALRSALGACGLALEDHYHEDRGDGAFVLLPGDVPKDRVVTKMPLALATALAGHNQRHEQQERVRLRVAVNSGEVDQDPYGVVGDALDKTFRLLDAAALKRALAASPGTAAVIASEQIYREVIRHFPAARPEIYQRVAVTVKETDTTAWVCLPDAPDSLSTTGDSPRWAGRRGSGRADKAKARLADAMLKQWGDEATVRSVDSPDPMPVRWKFSDRDEIVDNPDNIVSTETDLAGRVGSSDRISGLTGRFRGLRRRRLVIVGGPGTGKTTLAMQMLLDLLETRSADEPVPVMFSIADWNTETYPRLHGWLAERVRQEHPFLRTRGVDADLATTLIDGGDVLPVLDGLDDLPPEARHAALRALNRSLRKGDQLILTSRAREYGRAVEELGSALESAAVIEPEPLTPEAAAGYLRRCLRKTPGRGWDRVLNHLETRRHGDPSPLAETAATPLGLWLLRVGYINTGADPVPLLDRERFPTAAALRADLLVRHIPASIELRPPSDDPAERPFRPRDRHDPDDVRAWLGHLALILDAAGTRDFAWWRLHPRSLEPRTPGFTPRSVRRLLCTLMCWFAIGFAAVFAPGLSYGLTNAIRYGLAAGFLGVFLGLVTIRVRSFPDLAGSPTSTERASTPVIAWQADRFLTLIRSAAIGLPIGIMSGIAGGSAWGLRGGILTGLALGLGAGVLGFFLAPLPLTDRPLGFSISLALIDGLIAGLMLGLIFGPVPGVAAGTGFGLTVGTISFVLVNDLSRLLFQDTWRGTAKAISLLRARGTHRVTAAYAISAGISAGLLTGVPSACLVGTATGVWSGILAGAGAATVGRNLPRAQADCIDRIPSRLGTVGAWHGYLAATFREARAGNLPRRLMPFLDDMHRLGLLRAVGPIYQFRHAELQDHLAATYRQATRTVPDRRVPTR